MVSSIPYSIKKPDLYYHKHISLIVPQDQKAGQQQCVLCFQKHVSGNLSGS